MRLRTRFTLAMVLLAVTPTVITGALAIRTATQAENVRPEEALTRESTTLATAVAGWLDAQASTLSGWRRVWNLDRKDPSLQEGLLRAVHTAMQPVVTVALVGDDGEPVIDPVWLPEASTQPGRTPGSANRARIFLDAAPREVAADGVGISGAFFAPGDDLPALPMAVSPPGGELLLVADLSMAELGRFFAGRPDHATALLDGARYPLLGGEHPFIADAKVRAAAQPGMDLSFRTRSTAGELLRGAVSAVPGTDWVVVAVEPVAFADAAQRTIRLQTAFIGLLVLLAVGVAGVSLERTIVSPVSILRDRAAAVAAGDLSQRLQVTGADELVELASAFNEMTSRLEESRDDIAAKQARIEVFNEELQQRVDERTRELETTQARLLATGQIAAVAEVGAGLAHELNNPITAILGTVQLMQARGVVDPAGLVRLEEQVQRCREVVATMVRFASGEVDPLASSVVDLAAILREIVEQWRIKCELRGIRIELDQRATPAMTRIDPDFAHQLFSRLVEVMVGGLPDNGRLSLVLDRCDEGLELVLEADPPVVVSDDLRAAGLQLWVARRLVDLVGGRAWTPPEHDGPWRVLLPEA